MQKRMGPVRSVSFMMPPSAGLNGFNTVSVFCHMWSKSIPSSGKSTERMVRSENYESIWDFTKKRVGPAATVYARI